MKLLLIELCNYIDYPTGGHLSFARNLISLYGSDVSIVRISTDTNERHLVGKWDNVVIDGITYNSFLVGVINQSSNKPIIPRRIKSLFYMLKWRKKIFANPPKYDYIFVQTPEVMLSLPKNLLNQTCARLPGLENPLIYSRYRWAAVFSRIYMHLLYNRLSAVPKILATSNKASITQFIERSCNKISASNVYQFPTRYNETVYHLYDKHNVRESLSLSQSQTIFITVGRLAKFKGVEFLLESYKIVSNENTMLLIIGDGEYDSYIRGYIKEHAIDNVKLLGKLLPGEIGKYLGASDVFIMGSYAEGWSTALVEAVAVGLPCVVTNFSGATEMVCNGYNGYVVTDRDPAVFATKMQDALQLNSSNLEQSAKSIIKLSLGNLKNNIEDILNQ